MKNLFPNTIKLACGLLLAVLFQSCGTQSGTFKNDEISSSKRGEFHNLTTQLINALRGKDKEELKNLQSKEMLDDPHNLRKLELVGNRVATADYKVLDEYYVVKSFVPNSDTARYDTLTNTSASINGYQFIYSRIAQESYVALLIPADKKLANQDLIVATYAKFNYGWKLCSAEVGAYKINGQTAPELFKAGKAQFDKGYYANAKLLFELAQQCVNPVENWEYIHLNDDKVDNLDNMFKRARSESIYKYHFPLTVDEVTGSPQIFHLKNQRSSEGWFPAVFYVTKIDITDTAAVKKQNMEMQKVIGKILPGINEGRKYVYYSACNKLPLKATLVAHFDMVERLK
ncbi:hypothetical protein AAFN85_08340 [Mucilaginibacter sp. CAU 1740]|uniref:hypothetical protein n=1 Tax=Mucilaginibacter sp. CAU 1740 TaxID=3140365 RepID=UPI00325BEB8D